NSSEDLSGATKMDELVFFFNNTLAGNQMGATGGNRIIALNNLVQENASGGFKRFGKNSVAVNNLFFENGGDNSIGFHPGVTEMNKLFSVDPKLIKGNYNHIESSYLIDAGIANYITEEGMVLEIPADYISG